MGVLAIRLQEKYNDLVVKYNDCECNKTEWIGNEQINIQIPKELIGPIKES